MRIHLFEFEDLSWFPDTIRQGGTDFLRFFLNSTNFYQPAQKIIADVLQRTSQNTIIDLCSGGGGAIEKVMGPLLNENAQLTVLLTDKFPNVNAFALISERNKGRIGYTASAVDAKDVPAELPGVRTMFTAIHHFRPNDVRGILKDTVDKKVPIAIFDGGDKHIFTLLGILLLQPIMFVLFTPFFRPFKVSRIVFTYLLPLIPLMTIWDGMVSVLRLYKPKELRTLAEELNAKNYVWESGKKRNGIGMHVTYLVGYPDNI
jgi:hypothetical protein